jgi:hypothetical protein
LTQCILNFSVITALLLQLLLTGITLWPGSLESALCSSMNQLLGSFNLSLSTSTVLLQWMLAFIRPIVKVHSLAAHRFQAYINHPPSSHVSWNELLFSASSIPPSSLLIQSLVYRSIHFPSLCLALCFSNTVYYGQMSMLKTITASII